MVFSFGCISGGHFNPAVTAPRFSIGMVLLAGASAVGGFSVAKGLQATACLGGHCEPLLHFWLYWGAPLAGAFAASIAFMQMDTACLAAPPSTTSIRMNCPFIALL